MIDVIEHGTIRELRLNRPPVNALDPGLLKALRDAVTRSPDEGAEALMLSGSNGVFSAGLDVPVLLSLDQDGMRAAVEIFFEGIEALACSQIPIVAAITGHSPAGGAVVASFCDWRVMADGEYTIGFNEVQVGITVPSILHAAVARVTGERNAEMLCVTGRLMGPREAMELGVVDQVVPPQDVVRTALDWCESLVALPKRAMIQTRAAARAQFVEFVRSNRRQDADRFFEEWHRPESQEPLRRLVERLKDR